MIKKISFLILSISIFSYAAVFGIWDRDGDIKKQTISSKISSKKFALTIASLTKDKKEYEDFTGTVCVNLKDKKALFKFDWVNLQFDKEFKKEAVFKVKEAIGDDNYLKVVVEYSEEKNQKCPLKKTIDKKRDSFTSDSFCVRPYKFAFFLKDKTFISQKRYLLRDAVKALDYEGNIIKNYEKRLSLKYEKLNRKRDVDTSLAGDLKVSDISFKKGVGDIEFYFNDTAFLRFILKDSEFCKEDKKDTSLKDRTIYGNDEVFFKLDHFSLSFIKKPVIKNAFSLFTYFSNDLNHSASFCNLSISIAAKGKENETLKNYKDPKDLYFANPLDINVTLLVNPKKDILKKDFPASFLKKSIAFKNGEGILEYKDAKFNYKKDYLHPKNPFFIEGADANISIKINDSLYKDAKGEIFSYFAKKALFYYASFSVDDLKTGSKEITHKAFIDIYCDKGCEKYFNDFEERRINWFLNEDDNYTVLDLKDFFPKPSVSMKDTVSMYVGVKDLQRAKNGVIEFKIFNTSPKSLSSYIHIGIPSWLWHSSYYDYDFSLSSDCSSHPCFLYLYSLGNSGNFKEIETGNYEGVEIGEYNGTIKKRFLKVFR